jgi:hypothetical protein
MVTTTGRPQSFAAPERSLAQRMEALERANDTRSRRAQLKRDVKAGRQPVREVLLDPPEYIETMKVWDLLLVMPKWGRVKVNKVLSQCRISPSKTVGGLSERQRRELVMMMHRHQPYRRPAPPAPRGMSRSPSPFERAVGGAR